MAKLHVVVVTISTIHRFYVSTVVYICSIHEANLTIGANLKLCNPFIPSGNKDHIRIFFNGILKLSFKVVAIKIGILFALLPVPVLLTIKASGPVPAILKPLGGRPVGYRYFRDGNTAEGESVSICYLAGIYPEIQIQEAAAKVIVVLRFMRECKISEIKELSCSFRVACQL